MWWLGVIAGCGFVDGWLGGGAGSAAESVTIVHSGGMEGELEPCG
jgi:hypothetical protein